MIGPVWGHDPRFSRAASLTSEIPTMIPLYQRNAVDSAMHTWRRTFATSVARLGSSSTPQSRIIALRCAQILQASKSDGPCNLEDKEIKVNGFIRSVRKQKRFAFAEISDGSTVEPLQAILKPAQAAEYVYRGVATPSFIYSHGDLIRSLSHIVCPQALPLKYPACGKFAHPERSKLMSFRQPT